MSDPGLVSKLNRNFLRERRPSPTSAACSTSEVEEIAIHRTLRRDFGLTSADLADLDVELAIEAGLLSRPKPPER